MQLQFENLPLVEAVIRLTIEPPLEITYARMNALATRLSGFVGPAELSSFEETPGLREFEYKPPQLPGAVFRSSSGIIISLQQQLLAVRWLEQGSQPYPRFPVLEAALWQAVQALRNVIDIDRLPVTVANMVYVNLIRPTEEKNLLAEYFSEAAQIRLASAAMPLHELTVSWREADKTDLRLHLQRVLLKTEREESPPAYRLATAAGRMLPPEADAKVAVSDIHERLQALFIGLLSDRAKREWQYQE